MFLFRKDHRYKTKLSHKNTDDEYENDISCVTVGALESTLIHNNIS